MDRTEQAGRGALVTVDREALSQGPPRGSGIKVIGAGLPRTGTLSQKAALERLGFGPCFHMGEVFKDPKRARAWHRAGLAKRRGEPVEWGRLLEGYGATTGLAGESLLEGTRAGVPGREGPALGAGPREVVRERPQHYLPYAPEPVQGSPPSSRP
jgi:hypothetical protein